MPRGQQFYLLSEQAGWRGDITDHVVVGTCSGGLELAPAPGAVRPLTDAAGTLGGLVLPIGVAIDCGGNIYVLDASRQHIRRFDDCERAFADLPCIGGIGGLPRRLRDARSIAISRRDDLYIADTGNRRIQIFSLGGLALRDIWGPYRFLFENGAWNIAPARVRYTAGACEQTVEYPRGTWKPVDLALGCRNRVLIADYANSLIHAFDCDGRWLAAYDGASLNSPALAKPVHIAVDGEGNIYVVEEGDPDVTVLGPDGAFLAKIQRRDDAFHPPVNGCFTPAAIAVDDSGNLHISDALQGQVEVLCRDGGGRYVRLSTYAVAATDLVFDRSGNAVVALASQKQVAIVPAKALYATTGVYISEPLDSRIYRCPWHRILLQAAIPPGCRVRVDTLTSEASKTAVEILSLPETRWARGQTDSDTSAAEWDCLVQSPPGRYLWLRLTLEGEGSDTPVVSRLQVFYPRDTSLRFLPGVFSQDAAGRAFLEQSLSIADRLWDDIGDLLTDFARYFDPKATPVEFLPWLASWLGLTLDLNWSVAQRRRLVANAYRLFMLRGTPAGMRAYIELYAGVQPTILEHFRLRQWLTVGSGRLDANSPLWGSDIINRLQLNEHSELGHVQLIDYNDPMRDPFWANAHRFSVFVPAPDSAGEVERARLQKIVDLAKPAHTEGTVFLLRPRLRIGIQSYIGVDTVIAGYPRSAALGATELCYDTVLASAAGPCAPALRVGETTRIGSGTPIE